MYQPASPAGLGSAATQLPRVQPSQLGPDLWICPAPPEAGKENRWFFWKLPFGGQGSQTKNGRSSGLSTSPDQQQLGPVMPSP